MTLVRVSSAAFSDAIGGGLLDDGLTGTCEGGRFGVYLDAERHAKGLPPNDRLTELLVRLGYVDRAVLASLHGDALMIGIDVRGGDCDVPAGVLVAACHSGQRPEVSYERQGYGWAYGRGQKREPSHSACQTTVPGPAQNGP